MMAQRADDAQFGVGQRLKPIQPDGAYAAQPLAFDALRRPLEPLGAHGQTKPLQLAVHFLADREEGRAERRFRKRIRQAGAVAPSG